MLPVCHVVGNTVNIEAIVGTTVAPMIALCIHPIMVMSTCHGSIPIAPFAGSGGDMRVAEPPDA